MLNTASAGVCHDLKYINQSEISSTTHQPIGDQYYNSSSNHNSALLHVRFLSWILLLILFFPLSLSVRKPSVFGWPGDPHQVSPVEPLVFVMIQLLHVLGHLHLQWTRHVSIFIWSGDGSGHGVGELGRWMPTCYDSSIICDCNLLFSVGWLWWWWWWTRARQHWTEHGDWSGYHWWW